MACNADFILCDSTGAVLVNSSKDPVCSPHNISVHELEAFSDNCEYVYSDLGGAFDAIYHVIGKSFKANGPEYYVLAFSSKAAQDDYTYNIMENIYSFRYNSSGHSNVSGIFHDAEAYRAYKRDSGGVKEDRSRRFFCHPA